MKNKLLKCLALAVACATFSTFTVACNVVVNPPSFSSSSFSSVDETSSEDSSIEETSSMEESSFEDSSGIDYGGMTDEEYNAMATQGLEYTYLEEKNAYEVAGIGTASGDIIIPRTHEGLPVISIGERAFASSALEVLPITSVVIPDSVQSIGNLAFQNCRKLVEVVNKSSCITVTKGGFDNGYVGYYALAVFNSTDTYENRFTNDNGYIVYTDGEEKILVSYEGEETELTLPIYLTGIHRYVFEYCDNLTSVKIGDSVQSIGAEVFLGCTNLISVVIGDNVQIIGHHAFYDCDNLTSVVIPDRVQNIDYGAFGDCNNLTSVVIGDNVQNIGPQVFSSCNDLTSVYYTGTADEWEDIDIANVENDDLINATRYYYIENEADVPDDGGKYWHWVDGKPTAW